jgi:hypothetical protein
MRESDFSLMSTTMRDYLIAMSEVTVLTKQISTLDIKIKAGKTGGKKFTTSDRLKHLEKERKPLVEKRVALDAKIRVSRKEVCFIAVRSIWPANTHRCYLSPKGLREVHRTKSAFHTGRYSLMTSKTLSALHFCFLYFNLHLSLF